MSVLTKKEILHFIKSKKLQFSPNLDAYQIQPHSVDLRLGYIFYLPKTWELTKSGREVIKVDPLSNHCSSTETFEKIKLKEGQYFELMPKEFVITSTLEKININCGNIMGVLYPRSSINRRGLSVDLSGIIDVWYKGNLMIPLMNNTETQTIRVYPGERICQVKFESLMTNISKKEGLKHGLQRAKYSGSKDELVCGKGDKEKEIRMVKEGKIDRLKKKFPVR